MKLTQLRGLLSFCLLATANVPAAIRYVDVNSANPTPPYTSWSTAALTIQDAVDAAVAGDQILVTNGVYQSGGRLVLGLGGTNRVAVTKALAVQSVNGPQFTKIQGNQVPGTTNGTAAIRCAYLTNGASLSGFTLTNGATASGQGGGVWCGSTNPVVTNCVLVGNSAYSEGGGAYQGTLNNCTLRGNSVSRTDGISFGGGAWAATLNNCVLIGNSAIIDGGGAWSSTLNNCTLTGNSAGQNGGGAWNSTLRNCTLTGNSARNGGGAISATLDNCTLTGNSATSSGGGTSQSTLRNCIVYFNTAPQGSNYSGSGLLSCCTSPQPPAGAGNISANPQLASASHLSAASPCRGAGSAAAATGTDIDGEAWASPPSIGCDEYHVGAVSGPLTVGISAPFTLFAVGSSAGFTALIDGRTSASVWEFGDGVSITNRPTVSHAWTATGDYPVILRAYNESQPAGISATVTVQVVTRPVHYVAANSVNPVPPYSTWATAAATIQDAVDAAVAGNQILVSNGVYQTGSRFVSSAFETNRVAVTKAVDIQSVNGPEFTVIKGNQGVPGPIRCVYLTNGASLSGFTLTNGGTAIGQGGGVWCQSTNSVVTNCVLVGNSAGAGGGAFRGTLKNCTVRNNSAGTGGGVHSSTLINCALTSNSAPGQGSAGGGAYGGTLNNCTITGNSATSTGGGAHSATLNNCIVYFNTASEGANYYQDAFVSTVLNYCCTTPLPTNGVGNISVDPQLAGATHLSAASPCRGAGSATYATGKDIDGEAWANPPSIGCDEYYGGPVTGPLSVGIAVSHTNALPGYALGFTALIEGQTSASTWEFGDGVVVSNRPIASHAWMAPGDYAVVLRAYNDSQPSGISATVTVHVVTGTVCYVSVDSSNPVAPFMSWATAATNIQDAVDAAPISGGEVSVLVNDGVYASGGRGVFGSMTNRVAVDRPLMLRSVNGPEFTFIEGRRLPGDFLWSPNGDGAIRCVYLAKGASLSGFTLSNGATRNSGGEQDASGGGVWSESASVVVSNCVLTGNTADSYGGGAINCTLKDSILTSNLTSNPFMSMTGGGGAYNCTLTNCTLTGNTASGYGIGFYSGHGGGAFQCILADCTLTSNSATGQESSGGAASGCTLINCLLNGNSASSGGGVVGGVLNNCTLSDNSAALYGGGASGGALLNNCTLSGNSAANGGGVSGHDTVLNNCTLTGNFASFGGGVSYGVLNNCVLRSNHATTDGGGVYVATLNNCTLVDNSAGFSGGAAAGYSTLNNCIAYYNSAPTGHNYVQFETLLNWCCTTPLPNDASLNFTEEPLFVDQANGDLRLQSNSPCINSGRNSYAPAGSDLDGNLRIAGGTIDIGAYEFQSPTSVISYAWLQQYGFPTDGSSDYSDSDSDLLNNSQEWIAGTVPTNALSVLRVLNLTNDVWGVTLSWPSVSGRTYFLERATNLGAAPPFSLVESNILGNRA